LAPNQPSKWKACKVSGGSSLLTPFVDVLSPADRPATAVRTVLSMVVRIVCTLAVPPPSRNPPPGPSEWPETRSGRLQEMLSGTRWQPAGVSGSFPNAFRATTKVLAGVQKKAPLIRMRPAVSQEKVVQS